MKIKGRVAQIITPEKHENYVLPLNPHLVESPFFGKTFVHIESLDVPTKKIKRLFWKLKHRKEEYSWNLVVDLCDYEEGDIVKLELEEVSVPTGLFKIKECQD